jgi:hypothetical protein
MDVRRKESRNSLRSEMRHENIKMKSRKAQYEQEKAIEENTVTFF